jgi:hypothetical protein
MVLDPKLQQDLYHSKEQRGIIQLLSVQ